MRRQRGDDGGQDRRGFEIPDAMAQHDHVEGDHVGVVGEGREVGGWIGVHKDDAVAQLTGADEFLRLRQREGRPVVRGSGIEAGDVSGGTDGVG